MARDYTNSIVPRIAKLQYSHTEGGVNGESNRPITPKQIIDDWVSALRKAEEMKEENQVFFHLLERLSTAERRIEELEWELKKEKTNDQKQ